MKRIHATSLQVVVVDDCPGDYTVFGPLEQNGELKLQFITTGGDALRRSQGLSVNLWLINTQLPDLSGFDIVEMLQPVPPGTAVFLIGNHYRSADELKALRLGVSKYLVKPLSCDWLSDFRLRAPPGQPTIRAPDFRASPSRIHEAER